ncbi:hypothetical protein EBL89_06760 [Cereibacter sphaeroides]|uniref:DNA translocase FtsK n=1 Tax=Cereibacter sphaeroides TaxID=1063 RepID=UPI000F5313B1|nr:DNA translocase FtsK [Cereibacter sphaeroides]AZB55026.1 hypothetical protein EBL89_06760 [Cereibacter sphaeroides]AZB59282.1 hypothetical protein EBL88_06700 [Cereibacter sphaeroides]
MVQNIFASQPLGAPKPAASPKDQIDTLARRYQVPANVLLALEEAGPGQAEANAREIAATVSKGGTLDAALAAKAGSAEAGAALMNRAWYIADEIYPQQAEAPAPEKPREANTLRDLPAALGASVARAAGGMVYGAGEAVSAAADLARNVTQPSVDALTQRPSGPLTPAPNPLSGVAEAIGGETGAAGYIDSFVSDDVKRDMADLLDPNADLTKPETIKLGPRPTVRGAIYSSIDVFGSMAPVVIAGMVTKNPAAAAAVGGAMSGGFGAQDADSTIEEMATKKAPDGRSQLEAESSVYQRALSEGMTPDQAKEVTKAAARRQAAALAAIPGAFGGAATAGIMHGAVKAVQRLPFLARVGGTAALSGVEEGTQEVAEGVATRTGINQGAGIDRSVTAGTFNEALLGAVGGAPMGAIGGAFQRPEATETGASDDIGAGDMLGAPPTQHPGDDSAGGQAVAPQSPPPAPPAGAAATAEAEAPKGIMATVAASMPDLTPQPQAEAPLRFPDHKPGGQLQLMTPDGEIVDATFLREGPDGVTVRMHGEEIPIPAAEFDRAVIGGRKSVAEEAERKKAEAKVKPAQAAAPAQPAPTDFLAAARDQVIRTGRASASDLSRDMGVPLPQAQALVDLLEQEGTVSAADETGKRTILNRGEPVPGEGGPSEADWMASLGAPPLAAPQADQAARQPQSPIRQPDAAPRQPEPAAAPAADRERERAMLETIEGLGRSNGWTPELMKRRDELRAILDPTPPTLESTDETSPRNDGAGGAAPSGIGPDGNAVGSAGSAADHADARARAGEASDAEGSGRDLAGAARDPQPNGSLTTPAATAIAKAARQVAEPTEAQKEAGNYRKGHARIQGTDLSIETPKGATRSGKAPDGSEWSVEMPAHYGYFKGSIGADKDHVDFYMGERRARHFGRRG